MTVSGDAEMDRLTAEFLDRSGGEERTMQGGTEP